MTETRPPFPPFDTDSAITKVQAAEDAWNTRDPHRVSLAYTPDSLWRNRDQCREASINDLPITESDRRWFGPRLDHERGPEHEIRLH